MMTHLWAVNSLGKVYTISTADDHWAELKSDGLDFKKVSVHEFFTWAIAGDHQIYIYVPTRDVPIRCRVVTYENERYFPFSGYGEKLLPTDRPHWSSADGLVSLPQKNFHLPSKSWEWEEEWYVEDNLDGQPLEPEGWMYAVDFPATYGPNKNWNSVVRRRKWLRYRRFCATNKWSLIPNINEDPVLEPFIDVAIGGTEIPGGESNNFAVWAVTIMGRVLFRYGVTETSPEGSGWVPIRTPDQAEVCQISVGPTGLVWAVTWAGNALVRTGVTRENIMGHDWAVVEPPSSTDPLTEVSVGKRVVWALSKEKKVLFRKGVNGLHSGENLKDATGSGWIEMVGNLTGISVGVDDQVFSIDGNASDLLLRTNINSSELFGREWKTIQAPLKGPTHSPSSSLDSISVTSLHKDSVYTDSLSASSSPHNLRKISTYGVSDIAVSYTTSHEDEGVILSNQVEDRMSINGDTNGSEADRHDRFQSIVNRTGSYSSLDSEGYCTEKAMMFQAPLVDLVIDQSSRNVLWIWISASGCSINADVLPYWFSEGNSVSKSAVDELWYGDIIYQLKSRQKREVLQFSYPRAIEQSSWVKTAACRFFKDNWKNALLELVQHGDGSNKSVLTCHYKNDELATLNTACRNANELPPIAEKISMWSVTVNGDVYVHKAGSNTDLCAPTNMKWNLLGGGHLRIVETCSAGITWGLGYNCVAWAYTNGYGGGAYHGVPGSNVSIGPMSDMRCLYIYENQRWNPVSGYASKGLPTDRYMWSDQTGRIECTKENTHLPSCHWQWVSDWCIDFKSPGGVDSEGWQYAHDFPRSYHGYKRFTDYVRRRRWYRKCKLSTTGPWKKLGNTPLLDISFQVDTVHDQENISVWAVAINGDVLSRVGVAKHCPGGKNWVHIPSEKHFCSISVGGSGAVWGIAQDGSAQLRHGVCDTTPNGEYWCHIEPPQVGCPLRQISAGRTIVFAVDQSNKLWSRQEIVPIFKEGTHWKQVSEDVQHVSVGPMDQVWCIKNNYVTPSGVISGVVCRRSEITEENPCGTDWEQGIGGCWTHITVRGCSLSEKD